MDALAWTLARAVALDLAIGAACLFVGRRPIGLARIALAAAAVLASLAVRTVPDLLGGYLFLALNLLYVDVFVVVPALAVALLVIGRWRPTTGAARAIAVTALALVPIALWSTFVEPKRLVTERAHVAIDPRRAGTTPLRVAVLADVQCARVTDHERRAVARAMELDPHLILMPGDLAQVGAARIPEVAQSFRELLAPLGVYFVLGNVDQHGRIDELLRDTQVRLLDDRVVQLAHGDRRVLLGGVGLALDRPSARRTIDTLETREEHGEIRILMAHYPDAIYATRAQSRIDLVVAGHTHGGQVTLPWFGPLITLSGVPRDVAAGGLHDLDGRRIYVSRGIGMERGPAPRLRFLCPPEVSWLTLGASPSEP